MKQISVGGALCLALAATGETRRKQEAKLLESFCCGGPRQEVEELGPPCNPIEALELITEKDAAHLQAGRDRYLERVSLHPAGDRTK
jgi:hypothetical protein